MTGKDSWNRMRKLRWNANKRTLPREAHVHDEILDHVDELCSRGAFDDAVTLLEQQCRDAMETDIRALSRLSVARYGAGDLSGALEALAAADCAVNHAKALIDLNRSNILKVKGDFEAALEAAYRVRALTPQKCTGHLMVIAIHECRDLPGDQEAMHEAVDNMKNVWPGWRDDRELWRYLLTDSDYSALRRRRGEFATLFGDAPENIRKALDQEVLT